MFKKKRKKTSKRDLQLINSIRKLRDEGYADYKIAEFLNITEHEIDRLRGRL